MNLIDCNSLAQKYFVMCDHIIIYTAKMFFLSNVDSTIYQISCCNCSGFSAEKLQKIVQKIMPKQGWCLYQSFQVNIVPQ